MTSPTTAPDKTHDHKFNRKAYKTVLLNQGRKTAKDKVLFHLCECGAKIAYDMERTIA